MPISRKEFESAELHPSFLLEEFLRSNSDCAYTSEELIIELASERVPLTREEMQNILRSLETQGKIASKIIHDVEYYIYSRPIGFRPS